tara:strand:- start:1257 stop:1847 length:591 start_codon:yes stop_codon:yes gene_type:complete
VTGYVALGIVVCAIITVLVFIRLEGFSDQEKRDLAKELKKLAALLTVLVGVVAFFIAEWGGYESLIIFLPISGLVAVVIFVVVGGATFVTKIRFLSPFGFVLLVGILLFIGFQKGFFEEEWSAILYPDSENLLESELVGISDSLAQCRSMIQVRASELNIIPSQYDYECGLNCELVPSVFPEVFGPMWECEETVGR